MNDSTLQRDVIDELQFQPHINATAIGVAVENGVVSLTGHVATFAEKIAADRAVKSVKGVRAVAEEIDVHIASDLDLDDATIAARCLDVIRWNVAIPEERIQVKVQNGWVTLDGEVDWIYQKENAQKAVRKLAGIAGISNFLSISPHVIGQDIKSRIEEALRRNAQLDVNNIRVTVEEKTVTLEGRVHLWLERKAAERVAWAVPGVTHVENHILMD